MAVSIAPFSLFIGDDWEFDLMATDATTSAAINLTGCTVGAEFFIFPNPLPVQINTENVIVTQPLTSGAVSIFVPNALTATCVPDASLQPCAPIPPYGRVPPPNPLPRNRLHVFYTDALQRRHTIGVIPIIPVQP